jgi:hypothetical protein
VLQILQKKTEIQ